MTRSAPFKRSITIAGHRTSISLEPEFWNALKLLAGKERTSIAQLLAKIDAERGARNLSSAIRVHILAEARAGGLAHGRQ